ncbi:hypothetical protein J3T99_05995 [Acetobacteraceae bacterium B3987]|nr:hypothetical protein [Acetobacteraceae bacterium B3987]
MNLLSNGIASAAGAVGGLVAGPGNATANALNGASAASAIQQYNQALEKVLEKGLPRVVGLIGGEAAEAEIGGFVEDVETAANKYGRDLFEPVDQGISQGIRQIGDLLGLAISYGQRLSDASSGPTSVTSQNVGSVISSPAQAQMLKDYIFSAPVLSDFSIPLTKTDETGAIALPSWLDNVLMAKRPKLGKSGPGISSLSTSLTGGSGAGGQEPDDEESKQRKVRADSNKSPALKDSPYHPEIVDGRVEKPIYRANQAHNRGSSKYNPNKDPEPSDAEKVYAGAIRIGINEESQRAWYNIGMDGIYRFFDDNAGGAHFSGIMRSGDKNLILLGKF